MLRGKWSQTLLLWRDWTQKNIPWIGSVPKAKASVPNMNAVERFGPKKNALYFYGSKKETYATNMNVGVVWPLNDRSEKKSPKIWILKSISRKLNALKWFALKRMIFCMAL
jgi:hypothetical protein